MRTIELKGREDRTVVVVDGEGSCEGANHAGQWHLVWDRDSLGQRVRVVRMCPREADRMEARREAPLEREPRRRRDLE
jgi:hypothetical protein